MRACVRVREKYGCRASLYFVLYEQWLPIVF